MSKLIFIGVLLFSSWPIPAPPKHELRILTTILPAGQVGVPYSFQLQASGGKPPYHWALAAGSLPPGLNLADDGTVTGAPLVAGKFGMLEVKP
jgi:hypothetical protein